MFTLLRHRICLDVSDPFNLPDVLLVPYILVVSGNSDYFNGMLAHFYTFLDYLVSQVVELSILELTHLDLP